METTMNLEKYKSMKKANTISEEKKSKKTRYRCFN